ncbi:helix-turn-helix protein [Mucilaginibacter frigoritolerans]|uniref:Helix-turn-helix protein n=1 Tax=Mucilaginibacter frigoritolerans TaxID=652788 RepID=A0A562UC53_9SPHI|nr:helix-turn-helix transcriptional regulator [Mucilaginibacter frigoritolerans]TWJ03382.1 helix-turn-helix protein [Mucilaginibacter frigoritolerans]
MIYSQLDNPVQWLEHTAIQIGAKFENNSLILSGSADDGSIRLFPLEEGLIMILTEVKSNLEIPKLMQYVPADYLFFKLYLPDYHLDTAVKSGFEYYQITTPGVLLYNSQLELRSLFKVRQRIKIVSFAMRADWLKQTSQADSIFSEKRLFEVPLFRFEQVTPAILQSALNLFTLKTDTGSVHLRMKAIAYDMLSQFFSAFDLRTASNLSAFKHQSDIEAIFRIREQLLDHKEMNYPTIEVLAKQVAMSPSKLKTLFSSVFGMSVFEFYQHHRLNYARHLIEARKLTIGEVGLKIGYNNLSKFSQAYKKQFGYLPHQTLLPDRAII